MIRVSLLSLVFVGIHAPILALVQTGPLPFDVRQGWRRAAIARAWPPPGVGDQPPAGIPATAWASDEVHAKSVMPQAWLPTDIRIKSTMPQVPPQLPTDDDPVVKPFSDILEAKVWLTTFDLKSGKAIQILKPQPDVQFKVLMQGFDNDILSAKAFTEHEETSRQQPSSSWKPKLHCDPNVPKSCRTGPPLGWTPPHEMKQAGLRSAAVTIEKSSTFQKMIGFGASVTQASAEVLIDLKKRSKPVYDEILRRLFSVDDGAAGMSFVRFPIGSCDFSKEMYTEDDVTQPPCSAGKACTAHCSVPGGMCSALEMAGTPGKVFLPLSDDCVCAGLTNHSAAVQSQCQPCCCVAADYELKDFKFHETTLKILEVVKDAKDINPELTIMATPWSPPSWLKVGRTLEGGDNTNTLLDSDAAFSTYAMYLKNFADACAAAGVPLDYLSLQNEPLKGSFKYPAMYLSVEQAAKLGRLVKEHVGDSLKLLAYDHNWKSQEDSHYPQDILQAAPGIFSGTAFHCYGGNMTPAQDALHAAYPELPIFMTECTGSYPDDKCDIKKGMHDFYWNYNWQMYNMFLGGANHWTSGSLRWNLALDDNCGPTLPNLEYQWGQPLITIPRTALTSKDILFNQDYYIMAHLSTFVRPGAHRIQTTVYGPTEEDALIVAFKDEEAGKIIVYAFNTDADNKLSLEISYIGQALSYTVPPWGTAVFSFNINKDSETSEPWKRWFTQTVVQAA